MKNSLVLLISWMIVLQLFAQSQGKKSVDSLASTTLSGLSFRLIGPAYCSGRISDFAVNPDNPSEYYVAVASGHVWKTTNSGTTYTPVFDNYGSYSIGCVTIDPSNHNVVWVGTGEYNSQRSVGFGDGVYKSEDGGQSFANMGLKSSEHIGKVLVDPRNSNVVYVAAQGPLWGPGGDRGLYKTTDGGKTWKAILTISDNTGINDVICDPRNPDILYASAYQRRRHVWTLIDGGPECAMYKSTDAGASWNKINSGLPEGEMGRIGIAISPVNPDIVYAIIEAQGDKGGFFRTLNRGASWEKQNGYTVTSPQYYSRIFCDPKNADKVYSMDTWSKVTVDGGKTWRNLGNKHRHVDDHAFWIDPGNTKHFMIGGDGGIYESWDDAENWQFKPNLPVTQFYKVSVDNETPFYNVYGGTQDNASMFGPSRNLSGIGIVNDDWTVTHGGDGFETQVDPLDPNIVYAQAQYGDLARYDRKSGEEIPIQPQPPSGEAYRWNWDSPLLISPHKNTRLYFAANKLFRSDDRGNSWEVISPDLTRQLDRNALPVMGKIQSVDAVAKNSSTSYYGNIVSLTESPKMEGLIYAGTDDGLIQVTENGGKDWLKIDKFPGVPDISYVSFLLASQFDANTVYAAFENHKNADFRPYLLKSTDRGKTWKNISANLPVRGPVWTVAEDHVKQDLLFTGTEFGVFVSVNAGKRWVQLKGGLPTIAIKDIAIQKRENDLVLATFGRGYYILDNYSPLRYISDSLLNMESAVLPVKDALMFMTKGEKYGQGETYYAAKNPPVGATFTYYLKESIKKKQQQRQKQEKELDKKGEKIPFPAWDQIRAEDNEEDPYLLFTIRDYEGNMVRKLKASASEGINRITWDFRYPSTWPVNAGKLPFNNDHSGAYAMPGAYKASLSKVVDGVETPLGVEVPFNAVVLNNATLPAPDRKALAGFQLKVSELSRVINGTQSELSLTIDRVKTIREVLNYAPKATPDMIVSAKNLAGQLRLLQVAMEGDPTLSNRNENQPPSISGRINDVVWGIWNSTSAPTKTMSDALQTAITEFEPVMNKFRKIKETDLKQLETDLDRIQAPWTPGRLPELKK
ncbi:MAG: glycosyl hydrolase [Bacteroidetes bacterium]|nr:glycosyl hydrolase [Bacteroidota bacterium]